MTMGKKELNCDVSFKNLISNYPFLNHMKKFFYPSISRLILSKYVCAIKHFFFCESFGKLRETYHLDAPILYTHAQYTKCDHL